MTYKLIILIIPVWLIRKLRRNIIDCIITFVFIWLFFVFFRFRTFLILALLWLFLMVEMIVEIRLPIYNIYYPILLFLFLYFYTLTHLLFLHHLSLQSASIIIFPIHLLFFLSFQLFIWYFIFLHFSHSHHILLRLPHQRFHYYILIFTSCCIELRKKMMGLLPVYGIKISTKERRRFRRGNMNLCKASVR